MLGSISLTSPWQRNIDCQNSYKYKKLSTPLAERVYSALTLQGRKTNEQFIYFQQLTEIV